MGWIKGVVVSVVFLGAVAFSEESASLSFAVVGDAGRENLNTQKLRNSILKTQIRTLVMPGDNLYKPHKKYEEVWSTWKKAGFLFDVVAIGNHNLGYGNEVKYFGMPGEFYSKTYGNEARFIVLNSDNTLKPDIQVDWLDKQLTSANEKFVFVVFHHPPLTLTQHHAWVEKRAFQQGVRPLLWKHRSKITALIVGHDHMAEMIHFNDLPVVLSGAAWDAREDQFPDGMQEGINVRTDWTFDGTPHWVRLDTDNTTHVATFTFIRAENDKVQCTARIITGQSARLEDNCRATAQSSR